MHSRVIWLLYALIASSFVMLVGYERMDKHRSIKANEFGRLQTLARVVDANMSVHLKAINVLLSVESSRLQHQGMPSTEHQDALNSELKFYVESTPGVLSMSVMDASGTFVASSRESLRGVNFADRPFYQRVKESKSGQLVIDEPFLTKQNIYTVLIQQPVRDSNGKFIGAVAASLDPAYFDSLLSSVLYAPDLRCLLIHEDGKVFAAVGEFAVGPGANINNPRSLLDLHKRSGLRESLQDAQSKSTGDRRFGVFVTLLPDQLKSDKHLIVTITRNFDAAFDSWTRESYLIGGGTALVLAALAAALFMYQRLRRHRRERDTLLQAEREITAQVRDKAAAEIADLYENAPCGYHSLDADGIIRRINDTELGWLGLKRDEVVGKRHMTDFLTPKSVDIFKANFPAFISSGRMSELEFELMGQDGSITPVLLSATAMFDENGKFVASRSVLIDYRKLLAQQEAFRKALTAAPVAVRVARLDDSRVVLVNQAYCNLLKRSEAEAIGQDIGRLYVDPQVFAKIRDRLKQGQVILNELVELQLPDRPDEPRVWALSSFAVIDYLGVPSVLAWLYDISDREQLRLQVMQHRDELESQVEERTLSLLIAKEAAETSDRFKNTILTNINHEFRTPMNGILGYLGMAAARVEDTKAKEYLEKAKQSGQRLHDTLVDLVDFAAIESNKLTLIFSPFSVRDMVNRLRGQHSAVALKKGLQLNVGDFPVLTDTVIGDSARIEQIVDELIGNAIKFSNSGAIEVMPSLTKEGSEATLILEVADHGIGVAADRVGQIFAPFFQVDGSSTRKQQGNGIGLALSWRLARAMAGKLDVNSKLGEGSSFVLQIPVKIADN